MADASDFAATLDFIAQEASKADTPAEAAAQAVHMVASMIDGVAGWTALTPLTISVEATGDSLVVDARGHSVHIHNLLASDKDTPHGL